MAICVNVCVCVGVGVCVCHSLAFPSLLLGLLFQECSIRLKDVFRMPTLNNNFF